MGVTSSKACDESDDDTIELDTTCLQAVTNRIYSVIDTNMEENATTDAAVTKGLVLHQITNNELFEIIEMLAPYEKVALVFLLCLDNKQALNLMENIQYDNNLRGFMLNHIKKKQHKQILEALCVIQNYEVLTKLGYDKQLLERELLPLTKPSYVYLNKARKLMYRLAEDLTSENEMKLKSLISEDMQEVLHYEFMEMYFVHMFIKEYIAEDNFTNLTKHLKPLGLSTYAHYLNACNSENVGLSSRERITTIREENLSSNMNTDETTQQETDNEIVQSAHDMHITQQIGEIQNPDKYNIDPDHPGICLIIENIKFYDEFETYEESIEKINVILEDRDGSENDSRRLKDIFGRFGYIVIHEVHKTHIEVLEVVERVAHEEMKDYHSSFVLCVLSHGLENKIIGCNKIPVDIDSIKRKMNSRVLENKPKILIIQACQGKTMLKIQTEMSTDGVPCIGVPNTNSNFPWHQHIMDIRSTVLGCVSYRHKVNGTWMIQSLCDVLESNPRDEINHICVYLNNAVSKLKWNNNVMVPIYHSTLKSFLYLPPLKPGS